jgi:hypothetical protein
MISSVKVDRRLGTVLAGVQELLHHPNNKQQPKAAECRMQAMRKITSFLPMKAGVHVEDGCLHILKHCFATMSNGLTVKVRMGTIVQPAHKL